ncbi:MAG: DUF3459 domain-containing protein [bacterium]|nr:DUF3459 domain-containing protein [bacterium]
MPREATTNLPPSVVATPGADQQWDCEFTWLSDYPVRSVALVGDFNGWNASTHPLARGADGRLRVQARLAGGVQRYKFHVDGERWAADPDNPDGEADGHGGRNSLLRLGALARLDELEAHMGDGEILGPALRHDPNLPIDAQRSGSSALLRLRTLAGDVEGVTLVTRSGRRVPMQVAGPLGDFALWEARLPIPDGNATEYTFLLRDGAKSVTTPKTYVLDVDSMPDFDAPSWARHAIWYQILMDRFRNGDTANDPERVRPWRSEWYSVSDFEEEDGQTFWKWSVYGRRYGGDLAGLTGRLDYLADLGVNALYLNPVFQASTYHGYDATSFVHVDERFGPRRDYAEAEAREDLRDPSTWTWTAADRAFLDFVRAAHERGLKVIIDGVWNHVGTTHPAFRDVRAKGQDSAFADWFDVKSWEPFRYAGWAGYGELPVFKKSTEGFHTSAVEQHVFDVTRRWMDPDGDGDPSDGIDGWRLDVPNEIALPFWRRWREHVKSINPEAYLSGEIWDRADEWLDGRHLDAVMNYPFARATIAWIGHKRRKITVSECDRRLAELRLAYPDEANYGLMNLVGSHDTDRLASMLKNPDRDYDAGNREQDGAQYDVRKPGPVHYRRARLVALLQMTYLGAPMVYYGDEVGMWGADDPACRKPMLWSDLEPFEVPDENRVHAEQLAFYRRVIGLRRAHAALRDGSFRTLRADDEHDVWVFVRENDDEVAVVALNASRHPRDLELDVLDGDYANVHGDARRDGAGTFHVPAIGGRVWVRPK